MKKEKSSRYPKRTVYYDSFDADFVNEVHSKRPVDKSYKYLHGNPLWHVASFLLYRVIVFPIAFLYCKLGMRQRIKGREKLRGVRSYVLYCMHNEPVGDALTPSQISFPKRAHVVISPDNIGLPVIGAALPMLGGLPTPTDLGGVRNYMRSTGELLRRGAAITVYPEAHVWQGCTTVRPFSSGAFDIPVRAKVPSYVATRVYKRSRFFGMHRVVYIDGPFYPSEGVGMIGARDELGEIVHRAMEARAAESDIEPVRYVKRQTDNV